MSTLLVKKGRGIVLDPVRERGRDEGVVGPHVIAIEGGAGHVIVREGEAGHVIVRGGGVGHVTGEGRVEIEEGRDTGEVT